MLLVEQCGFGWQFGPNFWIWLIIVFVVGWVWREYSKIKERKKLIDTIKSYDEISGDYTRKDNDLKELFRLGAISREEYNNKKEALIQEHQMKIREIKQVGRQRQRQQIKEKLKSALQDGLITQEEYDQKTKNL